MNRTWIQPSANPWPLYPCRSSRCALELRGNAGGPGGGERGGTPFLADHQSGAPRGGEWHDHLHPCHATGAASLLNHWWWCGLMGENQLKGLKIRDVSPWIVVSPPFRWCELLSVEFPVFQVVFIVILPPARSPSCSVYPASDCIWMTWNLLVVHWFSSMIFFVLIDVPFLSFFSHGLCSSRDIGVSQDGLYPQIIPNHQICSVFSMKCPIVITIQQF